MGTVPVFLTYMVCVAVAPGLRVPQFMFVHGCVHALSRYMLTLTEAMFPVEGTGCETLSKPAVVTVRSTAAAAMASRAFAGSFGRFMACPSIVLSSEY